MDRRQRKTREAVFEAFIQLLSEKDCSGITVSEIIERADVGRATFYTHFETKDFLLKELCEELFCHIFDAAESHKAGHQHIFECDSQDSVFLHLLRHLQNNDNNILRLLSCRNNEIFAGYFKNGLIKLTENNFDFFVSGAVDNQFKNYLINHIAAAFVETVRWWVDSGMTLPSETVYSYFLSAVKTK